MATLFLGEVFLHLDGPHPNGLGLLQEVLVLRDEGVALRLGEVEVGRVVEGQAQLQGQHHDALRVLDFQPLALHELEHAGQTPDRLFELPLPRLPL